MKNIDRIIHHPIFIMSMKKIHDYEIDREFCCHGIPTVLMGQSGIYYKSGAAPGFSEGNDLWVAALLHDIGRWRQYEKNIPHEEAGAALAADILRTPLSAGMRSGRS